MSAKAIIVFCAQAFFIQCTLSQCTSRAAIAAGPGIAAGPYGLAGCGLAAPYGRSAYALDAPAFAAPYGCAAPALDFTPTSGGGLPVSSASAIAPIGLSVASENAYEGILAAAGELPFVGTVSVEGVLPTAGSGAVNHACGNGRNAMISEGAAFAAPAYGAAAISPAYGAAAYGAGAYAPAYGYGTGYAGCGCAL